MLIADDDVRNIYSLTKALEAHRMNVLSATDGKEAMEVLKENPKVNIVLMDMMMPEMDGYEATRDNPQNATISQFACVGNHCESNVWRQGKMHTGRCFRLYFQARGY